MGLSLGDLGMAGLANTGVGGLMLGGASSALNYYAQREQRSWEEKMANSAYQRATADMKAAGLNPGLMYGSGGAATTPNVAPPNFDSLAKVPEMFIASAHQANERQRVVNETAVAQADVSLKEAEAANYSLTGPKVRAETENLRLQGPNIQQELENLRATLAKLKSETNLHNASAESVRAELPRKKVIGDVSAAVGGALRDMVGDKSSVVSKWLDEREAEGNKVLDKTLEIGIPDFWEKARQEVQKTWDAIKHGWGSGGSSARDVKGR